jgi:hypothetical protein
VKDVSDDVMKLYSIKKTKTVDEVFQFRAICLEMPGEDKVKDRLFIVAFSWEKSNSLRFYT